MPYKDPQKRNARARKRWASWTPEERWRFRYQYRTPLNLMAGIALTAVIFLAFFRVSR